MTNPDEPASDTAARGNASADPAASDTALRAFGWQESESRLKALLRLTHDVRADASVERALKRVCDLGHSALGWSRVVLDTREHAERPFDPRVECAGFGNADLERRSEAARFIASLDDVKLRREPLSRSVAVFGDGDVGEAVISPIEYGNECFGSLVVERNVQAHSLRSSDVEEVEALAEIAGSVLAHAQLDERLRATVREADALYRAGRLLVDASDLESLLEKILDAIDAHFGHPICTVHLREPDSSILERRAARGHEPLEAARYNDIAGPSIVARVARTGVAANLSDVTSDPDYVMTIADTRSECAVPLRVDGDVIGVLNVESPQPDAFSDSDMRVLSTFAEHAAAAVRAARLNARVIDQSRRDAVINSIIRAVHRASDLDEMMTIPCEGLTAALDVQRAYVGEIDWTANVARFLHAHSADGSPVFNGSIPLTSMPELAERLWRGDVIAIADVFAEPMLEAARWSYEKFDTRSLIYVPVVRRGDFHAVLLVCSRYVRHWTKDELDFMQTVAEQIGTAFVQADLFERVVLSKKEWETTFDTMSDGVLLVDESASITGANLAAAHLMRMAREDLVGLTCCQVLVSPDGDECPVHRSIETRSRMRVQATPRRIMRPTQITVDPMLDKVGAVVVLRDVSELKRVEANARRQSVVLSQLVASATDPIAMLDPSGTIQWYNDALGDAAGLGDREWRGRKFSELAERQDRATVEFEVARAAAGEPRFFETALGGHGASTTWILATLTPVFDDRVLEGILLVGRDITGHHRAAERAAAADKLRALGQLSSGVAHNFNNALAVILGRTQLLQRRITDDRVLADLAIVEQVAHEASNTVRRIQNFARRRIHESFGAIDVRALVEDTVEMTATRWRADASTRGIKYDVVVEVDEGEYRVLGNDSELREVLVNVLFNALDAMPDGGTVTIGLANAATNVAITVADTGCGMPDDVQRRLFEPFFTTKGVRGTGLGLAVSYGIVSRHDGRIDHRSAVGAGTTFTITLPALATKEAADDVAQSTIAIIAKRRPADVLVVDDDDTVIAVIAEMLRDRGHTVRSAGSASAALTLMRVRPAALVITDLAMPETNGLALARAVRADWPQSRIVLMSGADVEGLGEMPQASDVDFMIAKPFQIDELCYLVESAIAPMDGMEGKEGRG